MSDIDTNLNNTEATTATKNVRFKCHFSNLWLGIQNLWLGIQNLEH